MTTAALASGLFPLDVAGAVPSRSALDLVQSLVHDAEPMVRQSYHELLVTVDVDSTYLSVDTTKTEVLHIPPVASGPSAIESTQRGSQLKWKGCRSPLVNWSNGWGSHSTPS